MLDLPSEIEDLKNSEVSETVKGRIKDFEKVDEKGDNRWFSEMCFCILTANSSAQLGIDIQKGLGVDGFMELPPKKLKEEMKDYGHRFHRTRSEYILEAREYSDNIKKIVKSFSDNRDAREWIVENVKGIGYKEGSHFLRNVGYKDLAILDRHVLRMLDKSDCIECIPKTLTRKRYLSIEREVEELVEEVNLSLAEMDLYIWYMSTGKILK